MDEVIRENFNRQLVIREERKWEDLNTDCLVNIFERVGLESLILHLPLVCKSWYKASLDPQCWKILDFINFDKSFESIIVDGEAPVAGAIKFSVKRSCGMATKVVFPYFLDDNIVQYVLERCAGLKSIILPVMASIADLECWAKLINKCQDLESLTVEHTSIEKKVASAIVTFVPKIKQLVLRGSDMDREDLMLILSGCSELELLDVRGCTGFKANDAEILTMASHIKTFMSEGSYVKKKEEYISSDSYIHYSYNNYMSDGEKDHYYLSDEDEHNFLNQDCYARYCS